jgi:type 1 glutamine amidotransferase
MIPEKNNTRRNFIQRIAGVGFLAGSGRLLKSRDRPDPPAGKATGTDAPRTLALIGDRYHNPDYIRVALERVFGELGLPIEYTIDYAAISAKRLEGYRLLVCLRDGMIWPKGYLEPNDYEYSHELENAQNWPKEKSEPWIKEEQGQAIKDFVAQGNGLYALHNSSNISLYCKEFREVMGGAYIGHPALRPFKVHVVNKEHPITRGVQDFIVNDEQHFVTYDKDPQNVLMRSENIDGLTYDTFGAQSVGGWAYDYGKGRVVFTAVGHTLHALWQPEYVKIQKNAIRWLFRMLL